MLKLAILFNSFAIIILCISMSIKSSDIPSNCKIEAVYEPVVINGSLEFKRWFEV